MQLYFELKFFFTSNKKCYSHQNKAHSPLDYNEFVVDFRYETFGTITKATNVLTINQNDGLKESMSLNEQIFSK